MQIEKAVAHGESFIAVSSWVVAAICVFGSVIIRLFSLPIPDTGEFALVAMSPLTFVGAALCSHLHKHLTADIVEMLPRGRVLQFLEAVSALLFILFGAFLSLLAFNLLEYALESGERLIDFGTPIAVPVLFITIGAVLMVFHAALDFLRACLGREPGGLDPWR